MSKQSQILGLWVFPAAIALASTSCVLELEAYDADEQSDTPWSYGDDRGGVSDGSPSVSKKEFIRNHGKGMFTVGSNWNATIEHVKKIGSLVAGTEVRINRCDNSIYSIKSSSEIKHLVLVQECLDPTFGSLPERGLRAYNLEKNTFQELSNQDKANTDKNPGSIQRHQVGTFTNNINLEDIKVAESNDGIKGVSGLEVEGSLYDEPSTSEPDGVVSVYDVDGANLSWKNNDKTIEVFGAEIVVSAVEISTTNPDKINLETFVSLEKDPKSIWIEKKNESNSVEGSTSSEESCNGTPSVPETSETPDNDNSSSNSSTTVKNVVCNQLGGHTRTIKVLRNPNNEHVCELWYDKPTEGFMSTTPLWHADNVEEYCEVKAFELAYELEREFWGAGAWDCDEQSVLDSSLAPPRPAN